jgi:hypothetical protein
LPFWRADKLLTICTTAISQWLQPVGRLRPLTYQYGTIPLEAQICGTKGVHCDPLTISHIQTLYTDTADKSPDAADHSHKAVSATPLSLDLYPRGKGITLDRLPCCRSPCSKQPGLRNPSHKILVVKSKIYTLVLGSCDHLASHVCISLPGGLRPIRPAAPRGHWSRKARASSLHCPAHRLCSN